MADRQTAEWSGEETEWRVGGWVDGWVVGWAN